MQELFGKRPEATMKGIDSIPDLKTLLDVSIDNDRESKERFPKPKTSMENLLSKNLANANKLDRELTQECIKEERKIAKENRECLRHAINDSTDKYTAVYREYMNKPPATSHTQFSPYSMAPQNFVPSSMPPYRTSPMNMLPFETSNRNMESHSSGEKRKKKDRKTKRSHKKRDENTLY